MLGPVIEQPCRELPKLPRGGDGRPLVSLRPSLGPRVSTDGIDPPSPRRSATASSWQSQGESFRPGGSVHVGDDRRAQSSSAPPMTVGSREASMDDGLDQPQLDVTCEQREQQRPMYPLRPVGGKERARQSYTNAGQRTIRKADGSVSSDGKTGGRVGTAERQDMILEEDKREREMLQDGDGNELMSHFHAPQQRATQGKEDAWNQLIEEEYAERSATVVLSSTVLLSPRGRARTPTTLTAPADGSYFPGGAADRRTAGEDGAEDWAFSLSPSLGNAQGVRHVDRPAWHGERAGSSSNAAQDHLGTPPDNDIRDHVTSMVSRAGVSCFCRHMYSNFACDNVQTVR